MKAPSGDVIPAQGIGHVTQTVLLNNPNKVGVFTSFVASISIDYPELTIVGIQNTTLLMY